jgi:hypothetical protein
LRTGQSLQEIAALLEGQLKTRQDFLAPQGVIQPRVIEGELMLDIPDPNNGVRTFGINNHTHGQIADYLGIPAKYYNRMREAQPDLLRDNVQTWLQAEKAEKRMVRTLNGKARGFLSPKYRPLDNFDLASAVLPVLVANKVRIISSELTETRLYIKGILPELSEPLPEGLVWGSGHADITRVAPGLQLPAEQTQFFRGEKRGRIVSAIVISNSEVGAGTLRIEPSVFTTWCTNLAILIAAAMKKYHVGKAWESDTNYEIFRDETRQADDKAFFMKVKDVTAAAFDAKVFGAAIDSIKAAGAKQIASANLEKVVDTTVRQLALPVSTAPSILSMLARGGDLSAWGLSSSITAVANTAENYELATQLEYAGGQVLALDGNAWDAISRAA